MRIEPEAYARIGAAGAAVFARDGRTLFHLRGVGLPQAWALDLDTGTARQLTAHDEKLAMLRRSPTDDLLVYGIDRGGDERQQLLLIDPTQIDRRTEHASPRALTDDPAVIHDWGAWSPDGARIAFAANTRDPAHFDVYVQDVASGARERVYQRSDPGSGIISVSGFRPDGAVLTLLEDRRYGDMSLLLLDLASGQAAAFPTVSGTNYQSVRWACDRRTLLALTDHGGSNFLRLCRLDPDSGAIAVVYAADGRDVEAWSMPSDGAMLATIENDRGYSVLRVGPADGERRVVGGLPRGVISEPAFSPDGTSLAFTVAAPTVPASIWLWRDGVVRPLVPPEVTVDPAQFADAARFVDLELVAWDSFDGVRIPGWLALPPGERPASGFPAVIWVHGGPVSQARPNFRPDIQMLLAHGFAVLMPNVRGSLGYGRAYTASDDVEKRLDCVTDLAHGRNWLAAHPAIDAARIGIMGQSYGGFMVNSAITEHPDLWRAAVCYYGIADFVTLLAGTGPWRRDHRAAEYGDPVRDAALFARISPIHRAERVQVPVLLAHGTRDPRVPYGESEQFAAALAERQKPVTFLSFDYAGHGFIRPTDRSRVYRAVVDFFTTHLA
jgi:dipeptidyl aminopeptidase/acylaminoacyl peptidase